MTASTLTVIAAAVTAAVVATPAPALALENGLARTPPMGFNNWNTTGCRAVFNEAMVKSIAARPGALHRDGQWIRWASGIRPGRTRPGRRR